ncbi:glutathionylspermidine synthase family protein [Sorangium sp. So ce321]|uniref:glutathionylspermidine synthase family protein n=1 Tax=Sorangium sp. So ce321 TaxID=3133300 RepID=UPI003F63155D
MRCSRRSVPRRLRSHGPRAPAPPRPPEHALSGYEDYARRLTGTGILTDLWVDGAPRFRQAPVLLSAAQRDALYAAAEAVTEAHHQLAMRCAVEPALLDRLALSPFQRLMWTSAAPRWHGIARADVFLTAEGPRVCELNSDTPSGQAEAVLGGALACADHPGHGDLNEDLGPRFCQLVARLTEHETGHAPRRVGILYPTEMTEDLSLVLLYQRWFAAQGWEVRTGSPYNLQALPGGRAGLFGEPCDVFVRHYKTDWWGERLPVWSSDPGYPDEAPLARALDVLLSASLRGRAAVVNPFGAVLTQNKRALALLWEERDRLPAHTQANLARYLPYTARLEAAPLEELRREKDRWVLKSDYGCEGDEVVIGKDTSPGDWEAALRLAIPTRWVAQRYFEAQGELPGESTNYGVYLIAGQASGLFIRQQAGRTDTHAQSAPALLLPRDHEPG